MSDIAIQCVGVGKRFCEVRALADVSFELRPGEILSILGPSGSGKTTLLRLIAGLDRLDAGEINIQGRLASSASVHLPPERRHVGLVFQDYALFPHLTAAENVAFGLKGLGRSDRRRRMNEVLELVRLAGLETRYPHELSGGQQQRVALARTLAARPVAVLLDEPFSNLDASMRSDMRQEVGSILRANGTTTVFVTHDREEAFAMAHRVGVLVRGGLEQLDAPDAVYNTPATATVARMAGTCDLLRGAMRNGRVITEIGDLRYATRNGPLPENAQVDLMVRADDFVLVPDPQGTSIIESREFRGDSTMLVVATPGGARFRCRQRAGSTLDIGTRVRPVLDRTEPFVAFDSSGARV